MKCENKPVLDKYLHEQLRKDTKYYHNVLKRVFTVVKYLAIIGLALRVTEEVFGSPHNVNFMGALGLLDEFDPFICELIEQRELRPKSLIPYFSKTMYEQIIEISWTRKSLKHNYNSDKQRCHKVLFNCVDSAQDLSHTDQLAIVLHYCFRRKMYERCAPLIKISSHTGLYLFNSLQEFLETNGLLLDNCRGQSFDNAVNMSGQYNGV
ncbi:zinc finger MYM-type protein 1 [Trichonephila clavipes]|uniref:Zinc finger MYM-type protein 1 n=1 Tax=Trichonephila clavipes TaxID=2585209 RepID=A0A8X6R534_TRICX|nr:zinc finger MYM-type protein 1 [Trichonephila clavipes]